jgi:DNA-binding SARP family transcriptional activator
MTCAQLTLLDSFELVCDGARVTLPMSAQRVLAFVALHEHAMRRPYVAGSLWLDSPEENAYANLRSALWRLHHSGHCLVETSRHQLSLGRGVIVDLRRSEALARCVLDESNDEALSVGPSAFQADLLPDWYDDWVVIERERYRQLRLGALDALCERLIQAHRLSEALAVALAAVAGEPLRESAHRMVVRVHLEEGNVGEAVRQYRLCRRLLKERLGVEPSERMRQLLPTLTPLNVAETIR